MFEEVHVERKERKRNACILRADTALPDNCFLSSNPTIHLCSFCPKLLAYIKLS